MVQCSKFKLRHTTVNGVKVKLLQMWVSMKQYKLTTECNSLNLTV